MTTEELEQYLKENLDIEIYIDHNYSNWKVNTVLKVTLLIKDESIAEDSIDIDEIIHNQNISG